MSRAVALGSLAMATAVLLVVALLPSNPPLPVTRFELDNPWAKDPMHIDQLRLSTVKGTTPNPRAEQSIAELLLPLDVRVGEVVADIGCGSGYTLPMLGDAVGPTGLVFAVEFDSSAIQYLRQRFAALGRPNVRAHQDSEDDLLLQAQVLDKAIMINVLHAFVRPSPERLSLNGRRFVDSIFRSMKPGGKILIIDSESGSDVDETTSQHSARVISQQLVRSTFERAGFVTHSAESLGQDNLYRILFERPK